MSPFSRLPLLLSQAEVILCATRLVFVHGDKTLHLLLSQQEETRIINRTKDGAGPQQQQLDALREATAARRMVRM